MTTKSKALLGFILFGVAGLGLVWSLLCYYGVWPPDIGSKKEFVLARTHAPTGERFKLFQVWNGEPYSTELEQENPNGMRRNHVIEGDARKLWWGALQVWESEKKLIIVLGDKSPPIEYRYDLGSFVLPPGRDRVRD